MGRHAGPLLGFNALLWRKMIGAQLEDVQVGPGILSCGTTTDCSIACVVSYVLEAEPTIRLVLVACRLSQSLRQPHKGPSPVLDFWLSSLREALDEDPFWGPGVWKDIEIRASRLESGIQQLVRQCHELESLIPGREIYRRSKNPSKVLSWDSSDTSMKPQRLKVIQRPITLVNEENSWMKKIILGCWTTLLADAAQARRTESVSKPRIKPARARSHTS